MKIATAATIIAALQKFFASFGLPEKIVINNGPQLVAGTFYRYGGIKNMCKPTYHPASNDTAEWAVQVIKQATKKMGTTNPLNTRLGKFLLVYCTTPHPCNYKKCSDELFIH